MKALPSFLGVVLLLGSSASLPAQHHGDRETNPPVPTGPPPNEDLKDFNRAVALQASPEQINTFRQMTDSLAMAKKRVAEFQHPEPGTGSDYSRAKAVSDSADEVQLDSERFLSSFNDAQRSGLKGLARKVRRAGAGITKQSKFLNHGPSATAVEKLSVNLQELEESQSGIAREMGIPVPSSAD